MFWNAIEQNKKNLYYYNDDNILFTLDTVFLFILAFIK